MVGRRLCGRRGPSAISHQPSAISHQLSAIRLAMRLGLIAGNGRFPFLVLDAARGLGHDVTVIALRDETFPELEDAAARSPKAALHWISLGQLGMCISLLKDAGVTQAVMAGAGKHTKNFHIKPRLTRLSGPVETPSQKTQRPTRGH